MVLLPSSAGSRERVVIAREREVREEGHLENQSTASAEPVNGG
jgi:hypothetical protein